MGTLWWYGWYGRLVAELWLLVSSRKGVLFSCWAALRIRSVVAVASSVASSIR